MAIFNKNTLAQVSGFDNPILAGELVWNQKTYWNLTFANSSTGDPIDLTGASINAEIIRRALSNIQDSRTGLTFDIAELDPQPPTIPLTITNINASAGTCTLVIDSNAWGLMAADPELKIDAVNPVGYSGRIKVSFPAAGSTPADDLILFLLFLVRSDGVVTIPGYIVSESGRYLITE